MNLSDKQYRGKINYKLGIFCFKNPKGQIPFFP
jgi:hypothetical protein